MLRFFGPAKRVVLTLRSGKASLLRSTTFCLIRNNSPYVIVTLQKLVSKWLFHLVPRAFCLRNSQLVQIRFDATPILFSIIKSTEKSLLLFQLNIYLLPNQITCTCKLQLRQTRQKVSEVVAFHMEKIVKVFFLVLIQPG